jgi:hypothetical protein
MAELVDKNHFYMVYDFFIFLYPVSWPSSTYYFGMFMSDAYHLQNMTEVP